MALLLSQCGDESPAENGVLLAVLLFQRRPSLSTCYQQFPLRLAPLRLALRAAVGYLRAARGGKFFHVLSRETLAPSVALSPSRLIPFEAVLGELHISHSLALIANSAPRKTCACQQGSRPARVLADERHPIAELVPGRRHWLHHRVACPWVSDCGHHACVAHTRAGEP